MDNIDIFIKALISSIMAAVYVRVGALGELLWLFCAAVALDYVTGVVAAAYNKQLCSGTGFRGILKKVGECAVIAVALLSDEVVAQAGVRLGFALSTGGTITAIVTIWLILNELISILENLAKMGIALPPFLTSAIKLLKKSTEAKAADMPAYGLSDDDASVAESPAKKISDDESPFNGNPSS